MAAAWSIPLGFHLDHPWAAPPPPILHTAKASLNGSKWEAIDFNKEILLA